MTTSTATAEARAPLERRQHLRVAFSPVLRPRLHLPTGVHEALDASLGGLSLAYLLAESARRRDLKEGLPADAETPPGDAAADSLP